MVEKNEDGTLNEELKKAIILETEERIKAQYEERFTKVRKEEKDKLYPEITKLQTELELAKSMAANFQKEVDLFPSKLDAISNAKAAEIETLKAELLLKKQGDTEMSAEALKALELQITTLSAKLAEGDQRWIAKEAEWKKEKAMSEISSYRKEKLVSLDESMHELVRGETKEEIDASLAIAIATYDKLSSKFGSQMNRGPKVPASVFNIGSEALKNVTPEDISKTSDADFVALKAKLGLTVKK